MNFNLETDSNLVLTTKLETMKKTKHIFIGIVLNEPKNMKAYKVELLVIDVDNIGEREITQLIENTKYIYPKVKDIKCVDIGEWSDTHPLNKRDTCEGEYKRLFNC